MAFLSQEVLNHIGFRYLGKNVLISDKASIYNPQYISIGDNSRIDDFAILSAGEGGIYIGRYVHIGCHAAILGKASVFIGDYSGLSSRVAIYSSSDNYNGEYMTNPCIPEYIGEERLRATDHQAVLLGKHVVVGTGSTILLGTYLPDGCAVGAMTLLRGYHRYENNSIIVGIPARVIGTRETKIYDKQKYLEN